MKKRQLKDKINAFTERKNLSKNRLAEIIGVSTATLSNIENDRLELITDEMALKIWNAIADNESGVIETRNFQNIFDACALAKSHHKMIGIVGSTGFGKSTALREFYAASENTYLITCQKTMSAKQFLQQLLREMGISFNGTVFHIVERLAEELNKQDSPLILIDEAGKLSMRTMEYLHDLRDATKSNAGIVMVGVEYFRENLKTAAQRNKEGMPEFYDRISSWITLEKPCKDEIRAICKMKGLTDKNVVHQMFKAGNFRKLVNYIENHFINLNELKVIA